MNLRLKFEYNEIYSHRQGIIVKLKFFIALIAMIPAVTMAQPNPSSLSRSLMPENNSPANQTSAHQTLASDGAPIYFFTHGNSQSPALIISPALTGSAKLYAEKFGQALPDYFIVAIELRGHGQGHQSSGYGFGRLAADIYETKKFLGLSRFAISGNSLGMTVVYEYIQNHGTSEIAGLFINDVSPKNLGVSPAENNAFTPELASFPVNDFIGIAKGLAPEPGSQQDAAKIKKSVLRLLAMGDSPSPNPVYDPLSNQPASFLTQELWDAWAPFAYQINPKVIAMTFWNNSVADYTGVFPIIQNGNIPVLIYSGKSSIVPWKAMQWVHDQLPGSEFMLFEKDVGVHFAFLNPPPSGTIFMNRLRQFLDVKVRPKM